MSQAELTSYQLSRAIGLARIVLIIGLVFLHYGSFPNSLATPFHGLDTEAHPFATWLNSAILFFFFSVVPLLSLISGWLFFSFPDTQAKPALLRRIRRRAASLYLPLVVWNIAYLAAIYMVFRLHPDAGLFTHSTRITIHFATAGWFDYLNAVTGITEIPVAFQFWFVRDLFVTVLISPALWWLSKYWPRAGALLLGLIWLSGWNMEIFFRTDVPFFFYLGALVRRFNIRKTLPLKTVIVLTLFYITLVCLRALAPYVTDFPGGENPYWLDMVTRLLRLPGVLACWGIIYRLAQTRLGGAAAGYGGLAFFLHSAHWPLLAVVKVALWHFIPGDNDGWMLLHYLASVTATVAIGLGFGVALARFAPKIFSLMNGGRLLGQISSAAQPLPAGAIAEAA